MTVDGNGEKGPIWKSYVLLSPEHKGMEIQSFPHSFLRVSGFHETTHSQAILTSFRVLWQQKLSRIWCTPSSLYVRSSLQLRVYGSPVSLVEFVRKSRALKETLYYSWAILTFLIPNSFRQSNARNGSADYWIANQSKVDKVRWLQEQMQWAAA